MAVLQLSLHPESVGPSAPWLLLGRGKGIAFVPPNVIILRPSLQSAWRRLLASVAPPAPPPPRTALHCPTLPGSALHRPAPPRPTLLPLAPPGTAWHGMARHCTTRPHTTLHGTAPPQTRRTAPHRTAPHRPAPRPAPLGTAQHSTAQHPPAPPSTAPARTALHCTGIATKGAPISCHISSLVDLPTLSGAAHRSPSPLCDNLLLATADLSPEEPSAVVLAELPPRNFRREITLTTSCCGPGMPCNTTHRVPSQSECRDVFQRLLSLLLPVFLSSSLLCGVYSTLFKGLTPLEYPRKPQESCATAEQYGDHTT